MDGHVVTVVIPTVGRATLAETLAGLERQTRPPDEVITQHDTEGRGVAATRNAGYARSRGDLVVFLDDDLVPPPDWLERLVAAIDRHDADGVGGTYDETDPLLRDIRLRRGPPPADEHVDTNGRVGIGGNVMFRRAVLERARLGPGEIYDENFGREAAEDWELVARLRLVGATLVYVPVASRHLRRVRFLEFLRFQFKRGIGIAFLREAFRRLGPDAVAQKSLLWGGPGEARRARWLTVLWRKALGPFDARAFGTRRRFLAYWLGEKAQALGFLWALVTRRAHRLRDRAPFVPTPTPEETTCAG